MCCELFQGPETVCIPGIIHDLSYSIFYCYNKVPKIGPFVKVFLAHGSGGWKSKGMEWAGEGCLMHPNVVVR